MIVDFIACLNTQMTTARLFKPALCDITTDMRLCMAASRVALFKHGSSMLFYRAVYFTPLQKLATNDTRGRCTISCFGISKAFKGRIRFPITQGYVWPSRINPVCCDITKKMFVICKLTLLNISVACLVPIVSYNRKRNVPKMYGCTANKIERF